MTKPIRPHEIDKSTSIPDEVIQAFNEAITAHWNGHESTFKQSEVEALICSKLKVDPDQVYERNLLDVEPIYRKAGWIVTYDKPAYNESYPATFTFRKVR